MGVELMSKDEVLDLIKYLEKPLDFYKDPIYTLEEKEDIKTFERLTFEFYNDLKNDRHITLAISKIDRERKDNYQFQQNYYGYFKQAGQNKRIQCRRRLVHSYYLRRSCRRLKLSISFSILASSFGSILKPLLISCSTASFASSLFSISSLRAFMIT